MRGKLYSVGIGPGDPELMTLKAVRLLKECDVVALPKGDTDVMTAKEIVNHVVDLDAKPQLIVYMPMTKDMAACGLPGEKIYRNLEEVDPKSSYFSVILVKEKEFDE